jgi:hypothetical protein
MQRSGAQLFARYAYPPNELGYCGPPDASVLLQRGPSADAAIARHARRFEGAWAYLDLIATAAGIADPLDARVVEAYWLGNDLLELIPDGEVAGELQARMRPQPGASWAAGAAHHGYQVFSVYPWVGLLAKRRGPPGAAVNILQQCRIRWGEVVEVTGRQARVRCAPLHLTGDGLELGAPVEQTATLFADRPEATPQPGDAVALHWDWVCDVISSAQVAMLRAHTAAQLVRANLALAAV